MERAYPGSAAVGPMCQRLSVRAWLAVHEAECLFEEEPPDGPYDKRALLDLPRVDFLAKTWCGSP